MFILGATLTVHNPLVLFCSQIVKELIQMVNYIKMIIRMIYRTLCTEKTFEHITKESYRAT